MVLSAAALRLRDAHPLLAPAARSSTSVGLLLFGLSVALFGQGAYYTNAQTLVACALLLAVVVAPARPRGPAGRAGAGRNRHAVMGAAAVGLAAWAVLRGLAEPVPWSGLRPAAAVAGLLAVATVVRRLDVPARAVLEHGLVAMSLAVALAGWVGVVWHRAPLALTNDGVWRAASTLTYANATAAVLGAALVAVAARRVGRARGAGSSAVLTVLMVGLGATISRAGLVAAVAGLVVLAVLRGPRRVAGTLAAPAVGAAVALAGLVPSVPLASPAGRPAAVLALLLGLAAACLLPQAVARARYPGRAAGAAAVLMAGCAVVVGLQLSAPLGEVASWRAHASSPARLDAGRAAMSLVADHPWAGVGPGGGWTTWRGADGSRATMRYVHDEYLQTLVDVGLPGLLLLLTLLLGTGWSLLPAARRSGAAAGALAALATTAVHAGFDFVWHVPAVPLVVATLVALGLPPDRTTPARAGADQEGVVA